MAAAFRLIPDGTLIDRLQTRWALRGGPATGFVSQPEPRTIGSMARGRQLMAGNLLFAGYLVESPDASVSPWTLASPAPRFERALHGFTWLDDLAALGTSAARSKAQAWTNDWIARHGAGGGPGWANDITGRRLIRWINHALFLLNGQDREAANAYFATIGRQVHFLARRWQTTPPGLPRFEALTGLIYAGLSLTGLNITIDEAIAALDQDCTNLVDAEGGLPTRNPEELLEVFSLLIWAAEALVDAGRTPPAGLEGAITRMVPTLRALRHADGGLARFHGGGRGADARLDQTLAAAGVRTPPRDGLAMGFARLAGGRTTVIVDAAPPPEGKASRNAHASTLAFELTSGRRPLIVNCGSGATFGETWRRAGRATPSHSTLGIEGVSSSLIGAVSGGRGRRSGKIEELVQRPTEVRLQRNDNRKVHVLMAGHDGYVASHGLTHVRRLQLSRDGRALSGEDTLGALSDEDQETFDQHLTATQMRGVPISLRFHLHPDVDAELDLGGTAISIALASGEIWVFRSDGTVQMTLEPSVYLEKARLKPRATRQIVLSGQVTDRARQIGWTLAKAQDTPQAIRDLTRDDDFAPDGGDLPAA